MDDLNALERQIEGQLNGFVGPVLPVDDAAIFNDITAASRSQRWGFTMFSALKFVAASVIVALFGGFLLSGVLTQPSDDRLPAVGASASASTQADPTSEAVADRSTPDLLPGVDIVTGNVMCDEFTPMLWTDTAWGGYERDDAARCAVTASDPRISGSWFNTYNVDCYGVEPEQAFCMFRGTFVLDNPDGGWDCTWTGTDFPVGHEGLLSTGLCTGTGGYQGLTHVFQATDVGTFDDGANYRGATYEGELVPLSEAITDPVEIVVAGRDALAGYTILPALRYVSGAEVSPDVLTDPGELKGRRAAVDIPVGTPITPDLLEPAE